MRLRSSLVSMVVIGLMVPALAAAAGPKEKTEVCHIPPGNPGNAHTISVGGNAADAHLDHGDTLGKCVDERPGRVADDDSSDDQTGNRPPVARVVTVSCVAYDDAMVLDGRSSSDPDGDPLTYRWTLRSNPTGSTRSNASFVPSRTSSHPSMTPDLLGTYVFELEVEDPFGASDDQTVGITTHMDVEFTAGTYVVEEGKTVPVTILFTELAPQDVNVQLVLDTSVAVVVPKATDNASAAISSTLIKKGDNRVTVHLYGVADTDKSDDSTVLSAVVGSTTCGDTAAANVRVDDDDVQLQLDLDSVRLLFVRPQLDPWVV